MDLVLMIVVFVVIFTLTSAITFIFAFKAFKGRRTEGYETLAQQLQGTFTHDQHRQFTLEATYKGHPFTLTHHLTGAAESAVVWNCVMIDLPQLKPRELKIYKATALSGAGKMLGGMDIEVGHAQFDDAFVIKSNDEPWIKTHISNDVSAKHLQDPSIRVEFEEGVLQVMKKHYGEATAETLMTIVELAATYANALTPQQPEQQDSHNQPPQAW